MSSPNIENWINEYTWLLSLKHISRVIQQIESSTPCSCYIEFMKLVF